MIIYYIAGGSYKFFYLNYFLKIKKCDLLILNYNIFHNDNCIKNIYNELNLLYQRLRCKIVVGVENKKILFYNGKKFNRCFNCVNFKVKNKNYSISSGFNFYKERKNKNQFCKIVIFCKRVNVNLNSCSKNKVYIFCDRNGMSVVKNKKLKRIFNKCSKIILK